MLDADKVNILIVDDLPEKVLVVRSILEELGENIVTAYSGTEALRHILEREFAVILLDVNMPDIDGLETASMIRRRRKTAHTPIIFVTAYVDDMHTEQGYSLGAVDYILAPVLPTILRTKVKVFVDLFRMTLKVRRQAEEQVLLAREQAARAAAEEATRRSNFLARAGSALVSSLDAVGRVNTLLELAVPELADLAAVTLVGDRAGPWQTDLAWICPPDPERHTGTLGAAQAPNDALREAVDRALATGQVQTLKDLAIAYPPIALPALNASSTGRTLRSALVFPLVARGRTLGALTLACGDSQQAAGIADRALAEDFADRAAIALDNALLYQSLQEADRHKNEFLAMLAHELRNPLAPVRNAVEVMRLLDHREPELIQARDMIDRQVSHMTRLVDDLLDMSRISRGKILLQKEPIELTRLVREVAEDHRAGLVAAGLTLENRSPSEPLWTLGDRTRMAQVVGNLLHNACKFTDPGGRVEIDMGRAAERGRVWIAVRDTGIGMEADILTRVFDTFAQADRSLDRSRGGLGLGLALVKGLIELHGGEVVAHSDGIGRGTKVTLSLPLEECATEPPATPRANATDVSTRILLIEDNADAAASMSMLLTMTGHTVAVAATGVIGLRMGREFAPRVVICDIGLPGGMDGYAVARAMREDATLSSAYIVALSGYGQDTDKQNALKAGFDTHLTKPVDFEDLRRVFAAIPANNVNTAEPRP